jgi:hypothetical protein
MKLLSLFKCLPESGLSIEDVCKFVNQSKEDVEPELDQLRKEGHIKGKRVMRLSGKFKKIYDGYRK